MINVLETRQELCEDDAWEKLVDLWSLKFEWRQSADEQPTAECREDFSSMLPYLNDRLLAQSQAWLATLRPDALLTRVTQDVLPYVMCRSDDLDASIVPTVLFALGLVSSGQPNEFQVSLRDALSAMWDRVQAEARRLGRANIVQQRYTAAIDLCLTGLTRRIAEAPPAPNAASLLETDCENVLRRIRAVRHMPDRTPRELLSEVWRARFLLEAELGTRSHFSSHLAPLIHCEVEAVAEAWLGTLDAKTLVDDGLVDIVEGIIFHGSPREVLLLDLIWYRIGRLSEGQPLDYQRRLRSHLERVLADVRTKARAPTAAGCASSVEHFDSATRFALTVCVLRRLVRARATKLIATLLFCLLLCGSLARVRSMDRVLIAALIAWLAPTAAPAAPVAPVPAWAPRTPVVLVPPLPVSGARRNRLLPLLRCKRAHLGPRLASPCSGSLCLQRLRLACGNTSQQVSLAVRRSKPLVRPLFAQRMVTAAAAAAAVLAAAAAAAAAMTALVCWVRWTRAVELPRKCLRLVCAPSFLRIARQSS